MFAKATCNVAYLADFQGADGSISNLFIDPAHLFLFISASGSQVKIVEGQTTRGATVALVSESDMGQQEATAEHVVSSDRAFYVHLQAGFRPESQLAIVYSSFRHGGTIQGKRIFPFSPLLSSKQNSLLFAIKPD